MVLLDMNEDQVLALVESGGLGWAWNIGRQGSRNREIRIYRGSILSFLSGRRDGAEAFPSIFPNRVLRGPECQRFLSCSSTHLAQLVRDGAIRGEPGFRGSGPTSAYRIHAEALVFFLKTRRIV